MSWSNSESERSRKNRQQPWVRSISASAARKHVGVPSRRGALLTSDLTVACPSSRRTDNEARKLSRQHRARSRACMERACAHASADNGDAGRDVALGSVAAPLAPNPLPCNQGAVASGDRQRPGLVRVGPATATSAASTLRDSRPREWRSRFEHTRGSRFARAAERSPLRPRSVHRRRRAAGIRTGSKTGTSA
ncbi:MAG: hypothetical protein RL701_6660 [Pseudomonadota bacterium]